jgi:hypothetical protein
MHVDQLFPSRFLKASDIAGGDVVATIAAIVQEDVGEEIKPVLNFNEPSLKGLVLNRTNASIVAEVLGTSDTRAWVGRKIILYAAKTEFQGRRVPCVRVRDSRTAVDARSPSAITAPR